MLNWKQYRSILLIFIFIFAMLTLALAGVYPNYLESRQLDGQIETIKQKIETQRVIKPVYKALLKQVQAFDYNGLDFPPAVVPATPKDIEQFAQLIDKIASENEMTVKHIAPEAESYLNDTTSFKIRVTLTGDFFNFRQLLIRLCYIAFLEDIESIRIHSDNLSYSYELWLILAQK